MRLSIVLFMALFIGTLPVYGQLPKVERIETVSPKGEQWFHPVFDKQNRLYVTTENYTGLYRLENNKIIAVSTDPGAGYMPRFTYESIVINPWYIKKQRRRFKIVRINSVTGNTTVMDEGRFVSPVISGRGRLYSKREESLRALETRLHALSEDTLVFARDSLIVVQTAEGEKMIRPMGEGHYIWVGLSPDRKTILFRKAGAGSFVSDLQGNILARFPYANAPRWSPDGRYIACMVDEDDGYRYTASDIYIIDWRNNQKKNITQTVSEIEMYPVWSADGNRLAFHNLKGEIRIAYLGK